MALNSNKDILLTVKTSLSKYIWHFSKPYLFRVLGLFGIGLIWAAYISLEPTMVKLIIDAMADHPDQFMHYARDPILGFFGMAFLLLLLTTAYDYLVLKTFPCMRSDVIEEVGTRLQTYSYPFFQTHLAGTLSNKISDLSKGIVSILQSVIDDFFSRGLLFIFGLITLFWVHPYFAIALIVWSVIFFGICFFLSKKSESYSVDYSEARSTVMGKVVDAITNIFNIKLFATRTFEHRYLKKHLSEMVQKEQKFHWYLLKLKILQSFSITCLLMVMMGLLIYTRLQEWITIGDFALVLTLTTGIVNSTFYLAMQFISFSEEVGICKQALSLLEQKPEPESQAAICVEHGSIEFDRVFFHYFNGRPIFEDLSLKIRPGEKVGLVGLSGSGKSTLAHLLLRLYEVSSGRILLDGQDIKEFSRESVMQSIAMIPQDSILFHRTVFENIHYGKLTATENEVIDAAKKAHCDPFIQQMKDGYQTLVGERGIKLSGGQRQRIAIARAILKDAPILILDEATSALDSFTEQQIQESLDFLMQGRTTLVIAHRLSTLHHMDRILVFEHGKIIEEGTHQQLLERSGRYAQFWNMQSALV